MHNHAALAWIRDAKLFLEEHSDPILSDSDTCAYFKKKTKKVATPPKPVLPEQKVVLEIPEIIAPLPVAPAPIVVVTPPPVEQPVVVAPPKKKESLNSLRALFAKIAPECAILEEIPNDAIAKKIANRWKTKNQIAPITLLCYHENNEQRLLLEEIVKALDVYFGPAKLLVADQIEKANDWKTFLSAEDLKLVIACDYTLWQLQNLRPFYKETPAQNHRQLGDKPLLMLPDLSLYLKDPLLKRSLWKALCQTISTLPSLSTKS